jgi:hypothetical protein
MNDRRNGPEADGHRYLNVVSFVPVVVQFFIRVTTQRNS